VLGKIKTQTKALGKIKLKTKAKAKIQASNPINAKQTVAPSHMVNLNRGKSQKTTKKTPVWEK
jgi:predicted transcriptional regulator